MRIVFLLPNLGVGGGVNVVMEHAERLAALGDDVTVLTTGGDDRLTWRSAIGVRIGSIHQEALVGNVFSTLPDVMVLTGWQTIYEAMARRLPARHFVYFVQSIESRFVETDHPDSRLAEATYALPIHYVAIARWIREYLAEVHGQNASYVRNGLSFIFHEGVEPLQAKDREKLRVLIEGPLSIPFKKVKEAFLAVEALDVETWLVTTDGRLEPWQRPDRCFRSVPFEEMPRIYASCDVLLKLSAVEGMFGPPLEMMGVGGIPVTSDVTGHDEFMRDGENGFVVEGGDWRGARALLARLALNKRELEDMKPAALSTAREFDWSRASADFRATLHQVAECPDCDELPATAMSIYIADYMRRHHGLNDYRDLDVGRFNQRRRPAVCGVGGASAWAFSGWVEVASSFRVDMAEVGLLGDVAILYQEFEPRSDVSRALEKVSLAIGFRGLVLSSTQSQSEQMSHVAPEVEISWPGMSTPLGLREGLRTEVGASICIDGVEAWDCSAFAIPSDSADSHILEVRDDPLNSSEPVVAIWHQASGEARRVLPRDVSSISSLAQGPERVWLFQDMEFERPHSDSLILVVTAPGTMRGVSWIERGRDD